jgi:cold shock CspA family protein
MPTEPTLLRLWRPAFPAGTLRAIILHWTAGDYDTPYSAYHFCLSGENDAYVHATHALEANMRELKTGDPVDYAAHTAGRNSFAAGIAVCAMRGAAPEDFGEFPVTVPQIEALCALAAQLVRAYDIRLGRVRTHAEAALADGYFGAGSADRRWDLARLEPAPHALRLEEATATGDRLRARIAELA